MGSAIGGYAPMQPSMRPAPSPSYFKEVVVLLHENVQETEEGRGWEANHIVVVTFDFTYEKPT